MIKSREEAKDMRFGKVLKKMPWVILVVQMVIVLYAAHGFDIKERTLRKGDIDDFSTGWTLMRED